MLWQHRKELADAQLRESSFAKSKHLKFFFADYKPEYWYWEIIELARKLFLTGFMVLLWQGTMVQVSAYMTLW